MRDRASVDSELIAVRRLPYGRARTLAAERILAEVRAEGPQACLAFAGLVLLESYHHSGEALKALVPFAQVVRLADEHPDLLDDGDWQMFLWSFKWLMVDVTENPDVPVARVDELVADMARRFALAGAGSDAVAFVRSRWADACERADAEAVFEEWVATARDSFSQCEVCDPGDKAAHLLAVGRTDEAVRLMESAIETGRTCLSEPTDMLSRLALVHLSAGRDQEAIAAHRRCLAHLDRAEVELGAIRGRVLQFLARAGAHDAVARRLMEDQRLLTGDSMLPMEHLSVLVHVGSAARLLAERAPQVQLELTAVPARTFSELDVWCRRTADELARRFDERYGDDHVSRRVAESWTLEPHPLNLSVVDHGVLEPVEPALPQPSLNDVGPQGSASVDHAPTADELLAQAEHAADHQQWERAAPLYLSAGALLVDAGLLADAGFAFAEAAHSAQVLEYLDGAHRAFSRAAALLAAGGVPAELLAPVLRAWAPTAHSQGDGQRLLDLLVRTGAQLVADLDDPAAGAVAERRRAARRVEAARVDDTRARLLASMGRTPEAVELAAATAQRFTDLGVGVDGAHAFWLTGRLLRDVGRTDESVDPLRAAADGFLRVRDVQQRAKVVDDLIGALRDLGRDDDAEEAAGDLLR